MALQIPKDIIRGLDEPTFNQEKSLRLKPEEIEKLGEYILRRKLEPGQEYFAVDFPVKVLKIINSELNRRIHLEVRREPKIDQPEFDEIFNNKGFIMGEVVDPNSDNTNRPTRLITLGYLLGATSIDLFGYDLFADIKNPQQGQDVEIREKELVTV